ncbi:lysine transporter LysE [Methanocella sp. CWC-04]|uniref:Lysine transporter LysE n=1 Tax=Methanooceanicella nereidis TaxID=2052831 RepID=A0AAP2RCQ8_9EURY|nr:LysE family transporter [Methanocella sp. CWC-04]MCD1295141.1 lysine transporter LysE [Methanocella sp. CWC-04]
MAMMFDLLVIGVLVGFFIAAPLGPISIICIRRTLAEGRLSGFAAGLGVATADTIYGCIAGFGITFISDLIVTGHSVLYLISAILLCYVGIRIFTSSPPDMEAEVKGKGLANAYLSTFLITIVNPVTIIAFLAVFAGMGIINSSMDHISTAMILAGIFIGSLSWWLILSLLVGYFRTRLDTGWLFKLNRLAGMIIIGFGIVAFISMFNIMPQLSNLI